MADIFEPNRSYVLGDTELEVIGDREKDVELNPTSLVESLCDDETSECILHRKRGQARDQGQC